MNLTIEQLSKATKLSVSTIRVYASQRNLGKKVDGKRVFTKADVKALLTGSKKSSEKRTAKPRSKKAVITANPTKAKATATTTHRQTPPAAKSGTLTVKPTKVSFWSRLFGGRKPQKKVGLMEVATTRQQG